MKLPIFSFLLIAVFAFSSCEKGIDFNKSDKQALKAEDKECFELVYPVNYTMPDGSEISGDDEDALWTAIKAWYEAHPDNEEKPELQYPVEIVFEDGTNKTIEDEDEMIVVKKDCDDKDWDEDCFEFVYPLTYTMPDGSEISGDDEDALWTAIKAWYEAHPDNEEKPELQYPVEIVFEDGTNKTIEDEDEMIDTKEDCGS